MRCARPNNVHTVESVYLVSCVNRVINWSLPASVRAYWPNDGLNRAAYIHKSWSCAAIWEIMSRIRVSICDWTSKKSNLHIVGAGGARICGNT